MTFSGYWPTAYLKTDATFMMISSSSPRSWNLAAALLIFSARDAAGQGVAQCFVLSFGDDAHSSLRDMAGDTLVLSDLPLGRWQDETPRGGRAFFGLSSYRSPEELNHFSLIWHPTGSDLLMVRPILFLVARLWRAERTEAGLDGRVIFATDEVDAPKMEFSFEGRRVPCPDR
ncbi:MAG: hypothetical protein ACRELV_12790 [Longimicrobiales bacterium]